MNNLSLEQALRYQNARHSLEMWEEALLDCNESDLDVFEYYAQKYITRTIELYIIEEELKG